MGGGYQNQRLPGNSVPKSLFNFKFGKGQNVYIVFSLQNQVQKVQLIKILDEHDI